MGARSLPALSRLPLQSCAGKDQHFGADSSEIHSAAYDRKKERCKHNIELFCILPYLLEGSGGRTAIQAAKAPAIGGRPAKDAASERLPNTRLWPQLQRSHVASRSPIQEVWYCKNRSHKYSCIDSKYLQNGQDYTIDVRADVSCSNHVEDYR